jgi:hypothetical protein
MCFPHQPGSNCHLSHWFSCWAYSSSLKIGGKNVPSKRQLTCNGVHVVIFQDKELFLLSFTFTIDQITRSLKLCPLLGDSEQNIYCIC